MLRTMHLFAGIGGGLLADLILGHKPVVAVEWEPYACQVLRERAAEGWFPDLRVWEGDVRMFDPSEYAGKVDCIHAGFPCQDVSTAGLQKGVGEETRSGLYREVLRISDMVRPRFIFLENVAAIVHNGLGTVLGDLAERGFDARWCCLRASDVGASHRRNRWWLIATNSDSVRKPQQSWSIEKFKESARKCREKRKDKIFSLYGRNCAICGFEDKRALSIDHINGNGAEERKSIGRWGYVKKASNEYLPEEYRILCMNCQFIENYKRMYG